MTLDGLVSLGEVEVWVGVIRLDARGLLKKWDGLVPLALDDVDDAEVVVGEELSGVRVQLHSEFSRRVVEPRGPVLQEVGEAEVVVRAREVRVERDRLFEFVNRFGEERGLAVGATEEDVKLRAVAEAREHAVVNLPGGREFALLEVGEAERVGDVVVVWRELQGRLKLGDRAGKV